MAKPDSRKRKALHEPSIRSEMGKSSLESHDDDTEGSMLRSETLLLQSEVSVLREDQEVEVTPNGVGEKQARDKGDDTLLYWETIWETIDKSPTDKALLHLIRGIPRFPEKLRKSFEDATQAQEAEDATEEPFILREEEMIESVDRHLGGQQGDVQDSPRFRALLERAQQAEQRAQQAERRAQQAEQRAQEERKARVRAEILSELSQMKECIQKIYGQLMNLAGLSQADPPPSGTISRIESEPVDAEDTDDEPCLPARFENYRILEQIEKKQLSLSELLGEDGDSDCEHNDLLRTFSTAFQEYLSQSTVLRLGKDIDRTKYQQLMQDSLPLFEAQLLNSFLSSESPRENSYAGHKYVPGPKSMELVGAQPFLLVFLEALGICLQTNRFQHLAENAASIPSSPLKSGIGSNRPVAGTRLRKKRFVDKSLYAPGRYVFMLRDDAIEIPVEEKSGERTGANPNALLEEGVAQVVAHLARHVGVAFNFAGFGIDSFATGLVLTPAYVKIVVLRLENMGTKSGKLVFESTDCLPLMLEKHFLTWCKRDIDDDVTRWADIKGQLYPGGTDEGIPKGVTALWKLMSTTRKRLFGLMTDSVSPELGSMLALGAFATIYEGKDDADEGKESSTTIVKVSRYGATVHIENESRILRALSSPPHMCENIPKWVRAGDINVNIGGVQKQLASVTTKPRGVDVQIALSINPTLLASVGYHIKKALDFVHQNGYVHNDVSPKNIVVVNWEKAVLIDFGLASEQGTMLKGFRGTNCFVHRSIFKTYPRKMWRPMPAYDVTSLGFTMAALARGGPVCWSSFRLRKETAETVAKEVWEWAEKRLEMAQGILKDKKCPPEWNEWCMKDREESR